MRRQLRARVSRMLDMAERSLYFLTVPFEGDVAVCHGEHEDLELLWLRAQGQEHGQDIVTSWFMFLVNMCKRLIDRGNNNNIIIIREFSFSPGSVSMMILCFGAILELGIRARFL